MIVRYRMLNEQARELTKMHDDDSCWDVRSSEDVEIFPGQIETVTTGLTFHVRWGWEIQVRSRSGLAARGITVLNAPGTVDAGYRGELKIILHNCGNHPFKVSAGDRIAQLIAQPVVSYRFELVHDAVFPSSLRADRGFGSTGVK